MAYPARPMSIENLTDKILALFALTKRDSGSLALLFSCFILSHHVSRDLSEFWQNAYHTTLMTGIGIAFVAFVLPRWRSFRLPQRSGRRTALPQQNGDS